MKILRLLRPRPAALVALAVLAAFAAFRVLGGGALLSAATAAVGGETTKAVTGPPPTGRQTATFAAGCFWSMEAIFKQLKGVDKVEPGYSGGTMSHPSYDLVENGNTGYAESVNITFDPKVISYHNLLTVLLTVRDPTTLNKQGPDEGPQYRSVIFYRSPEQKKIAEQTIQEIGAKHVWTAPIVTTVQPFHSFWRAEDYHLDYYRLHPENPYCAQVIAPEIAVFRQKFRSMLKN